jgi:hypothetical protein
VVYTVFPMAALTRDNTAFHTGPVPVHTRVSIRSARDDGVGYESSIGSGATR